jgi:hypothetical protein
VQRHSIGCRVPFPRRPALDPPETVGADAGDGIRCAPPAASRSCMMAQMCLHAESRLNVSILMVGEKLGLLLLLGSPVVAGRGLHATPLVVLTGMSLTLYAACWDPPGTPPYLTIYSRYLTGGGVPGDPYTPLGFPTIEGVNKMAWCT